MVQDDTNKHDEYTACRQLAVAIFGRYQEILRICSFFLMHGSILMSIKLTNLVPDI